MRETKPTKMDGYFLVKRPDDIDAPGEWKRVTTITIRGGQPRPYADSVYEQLITFEGGARSNEEGWDVPFAIMPPWKPDRPCVKTIPSEEVRKERWETYIKKLLNQASRGWATEKDDRRMGSSWLDSWECVEAEPTHTTYRVIIIEPYMD